MMNNGIGSWIHRRVLGSGDKPAVIFEGRELSYRELDTRILGLANALRHRGIQQGDRIAYLGDNHPAFLETLFAAGTLGCVFVPINTRLAEPEIRLALADSGSVAFLFSEALGTISRNAAAGVGVQLLIEVGGHRSPPDNVVDYDKLVSAASTSVVDVEVGLDDDAMILYTSGTTGRPKGAVISHGNMTWSCLNVLAEYDLVSSDIALMISPLFHVASLGMGTLPAFLKGATVVLESRFDPGVALELIERHRATWISGVPTTFQMMAEHPDWTRRDISSLQKLTCGGSPVPLRVIDAYQDRGLSFTGGYGMTEAGPGVTTLHPEWTREKIGSSGVQHFFTQMRIVNDIGEPVGIGDMGEIQISGPNVIRRYWGSPQLPPESVTPDGWFRTGDLGYQDDDGFLFISDRLKDMIISGGENVYPAEVERLIIELPQVGSVAVIGVPDDRWGEVPVAVVTPRDGAVVTAEDVQRHLAGKIARYKTPKSIIIVEELPRTASGKIRKADLRAQYSSLSAPTN